MEGTSGIQELLAQPAVESGLSDLEREVAQLIIENLNVEVKAADIDPNGHIFGEGLGLDSIDALEIALLVQRKYGVTITQGEERNQEIFRSVRTLSQFITEQRAA
jgi:acyl carrier protein